MRSRASGLRRVGGYLLHNVLVLRTGNGTGKEITSWSLRMRFIMCTMVDGDVSWGWGFGGARFRDAMRVLAWWGLARAEGPSLCG
jgi:hypothetical protein